MKRIALFASGSGTNAEAIARYFAASDEVEVALCLSNRENAAVHERMRRLGIPSRTLPREVWQEGSEVLEILRREGIALVALAGFLAYIPPLLVKAYEGRLLNIHPSLLPRHGGKGMWGHHVHEAVLAAHDVESGITIHYVSEQMDRGEIIFQATCPVLPTDTPDTLAQRVHQLEYEHYPRVIERILKKESPQTP